MQCPQLWRMKKMDRLNWIIDRCTMLTPSKRKNSAVILISAKGEFSAKKITRIEDRHFANKFSRKI